ncbi:MAG: hypothetical protein WHS83_19245, partial [Chloroflexus sp.]|uniref:hypothetical protein n=1 Tax=Chloroflexus sp. TaxID=1904827 RepID=UPI00309E6A80
QERTTRYQIRWNSVHETRSDLPGTIPERRCAEPAFPLRTQRHHVAERIPLPERIAVSRGMEYGSVAAAATTITIQREL